MSRDSEDLLNFEEEFHSNEHDRKIARKEQRRAIQQDRSQYKKTDQDQLKKQAPLNVKTEGILGRTIAIYPEGIMVESDDKVYRCSLKGSLKKEKTQMKNLVAVGDFVRFETREHEEGIILSVEPRTSILSRADNLLRRKEQLIAVNIDQVIITASVVSPPLKPFLIDRYIIASQKGNMTPIIVVNKIDLLEKESEEAALLLECQEAYEALGIPFLVISIQTGEGMDALKKIMQGKSSVFSGQSGVGKSSLINLVTGGNLKTGDVVNRTFKGSHTTTSTHLVKLEKGGHCIDTPGIKSFGVWDLDEFEIGDYFAEISKASLNCKFPNCTHQSEPHCAVKQALEEGTIPLVRFASYAALMETLQQKHRNR